MTSNPLTEKTKLQKNYLQAVLCLILAGGMIALGDGIRAAIYEGFVFSFSTIIPTLFPFFILSDLWCAFFIIDPQTKCARIFSKIFGVSAIGLSALLSGMICGFPVGVKVASQLYREGVISKEELNIISGFVNNPSLAFVISGVGAGMLGNIKLGILLYFAVVSSALSVGILFRGKNLKFKNSDDNFRQNFNLVNSISSAGISSVNVASCIVFFSGLLALISGVLKNEAVISIISLFSEVSNAVKRINSGSYDLSVKLIMTAFALGFSGFSVHLQAFSFLPSEASKSKYLLMKLTQGLFSALFIMVAVILF